MEDERTRGPQLGVQMQSNTGVEFVRADIKDITSLIFEAAFRPSGEHDSSRGTTSKQTLTTFFQGLGARRDGRLVNQSPTGSSKLGEGFEKLQIREKTFF